MKAIYTILILLLTVSSSHVLAQSNPSFGATTYPYLGPAQYGAIGLPRGEIMFSNTNTQNQLYLMQNGFMGSSGSFQYRNSSVASAIGLDNGNIFFFTAPSGTASTNIPLAARLIMGNDGNMRVGTLSSTAKGRLHIGAEDKSVRSALSIRQSNSDLYGFDIGLDQSLNGNMFLYRVFADVKYSVMEFDRNNGNIGIGTTIVPDAKLTVKGTIHTNEVKVDLLGAVAPDYVFDKDYNLPTLESIKTYIDKNKHLPEVPSAAAMKANGINLGEMNMLLLKKVEELTLYQIEAMKRIEKLEAELKSKK